ncbi:PREDICTED: uncharacterized protein LOC109115735 [Nelumbo nucifera]|uniref:Uncharacterized protein LOC109115735 n=1 Tax=Nelumbo nucifera TaxID=4432 RepID=A0A1U8Q9Z4_NELNU|nr:PREDICTED: uncharacterized protein LOC109115735 [Nelumbo nucifera]
MDFCASAADTSLFVFCSKHVTLYLLIYVDDVLLIGNSQSAIHNCFQELSRHFSLKDLGSTTFFLGIQLLRHSNGVLLSQRQYITDLLQQSHMDAAKPISSPMVVHPKLTRHDGSPLTYPTKYWGVAGTLQYVAITRPDISFVVSKVSQFLQAPTDVHWATVKRILRYLKHTIMHGLHISRTSSTSLTLHAFSDADWAGCPDDRRSTSGFSIYLGPNLIAWSSHK